MKHTTLIKKQLTFKYNIFTKLTFKYNIFKTVCNKILHKHTKGSPTYGIKVDISEQVKTIYIYTIY